MCFAPQRCTLFRHLNFQKVFWTWCALYILTTSTCASRHNGVHFLNIATSKSGPNMVWFLHFDFQMCFATTGQLSFQKCSEREVFLRSLQRCFASQGVQLFISHLARWLRARRFSEPTFSSPEPQIIGSSVSRLSYLFAHLHLLSSHSFSFLIFSLLLFSSLTLPTSAFPSVHIVGSLASKLPSVIHMHTSYP